MEDSLCNNCMVGKRTIELDEKEPMCPYISCHSGEYCPHFAEITKDEAEDGDKK